MALPMSCPTAACFCMQTIFSCIDLYILLLTIKPCRLTLMHYLTGFQPTSYSLTVLMQVYACVSKEGSHHANYTTSQQPTPKESVFLYKYLGILLTSNLSWSAHISTLCSKPDSKLVCSIANFIDTLETLKQLYVAFIHPNLEYATAVWDPHLFKDIQ